MPRHDSHLKQDVRARMRATGERYTQARLAVLARRRLDQTDWLEAVPIELAATLPIGPCPLDFDA